MFPTVQPPHGLPMKVSDLTSADEGKFTGLRRGYGEDENVRSVSPPMALLTMGVDGKPPSPELIARLWRAKRQRMEDEHWYKNTPRRDAASPTPSDGHETIETYAPKLNCNKIRTKIQQLIDSGEYKVTHFQRELGIASNSYGRFIKLKGPWNGADNKRTMPLTSSSKNARRRASRQERAQTRSARATMARRSRTVAPTSPEMPTPRTRRRRPMFSMSLTFTSTARRATPSLCKTRPRRSAARSLLTSRKSAAH